MTRISKDHYKMPDGKDIFVSGGETPPEGATLWNGYDYIKQQWIFKGKRDTRTLEQLRKMVSNQ